MSDPFAIVTIIHWVAVVLYVIATLANAAGLIFRRPGWSAFGWGAVVAGLAVHGAGLLYWWQFVGHGPYMGRFEVLSSNAWIILVLFLVSARVLPGVKPASLVVFPAVFILIAIGIFFTPEVMKLPPTLRSVWLVLHVIFYKVALGALIIGLAFSLFIISNGRAAAGWRSRLPDPESMDLLAYRFAGFGFTFWAIAMLTGSVWAYQSWGRFWGWDPVETWSLITWVMFGVHLHLRRFFGWQGKRAAWLFVACFMISLVAIFFTPLLESSIHSEYFK